MRNIFFYVVTAVTLLISPHSNFAQRNPPRPGLSSLQNYVFFTVNGAIENTERSRITGDIGSNVGAITGFKNFDGSIRAASTAAKTDLDNVVIGLDSLTPDSIHAPLLGGEEVLFKGVYRLPEATAVAGNLILDAQGDENAKFIFQVKGALNTVALSAVILRDGALACNVFWRAEDAVNLGALSTMTGTVVTTGAIKAATGAHLQGRLLSTVGAITVSQIFAALPLGCSSPHLVGPAAPDLLTTKNFGLFTTTGAMSNTGVSHITGDVGSNSQPPSGFADSMVTGEIHLLPDDETAQAAEDLVKVYDDLNGRFPDIELLDPADLGFGLILSPHTYVLPAETVLADTLFLDAQGDPDARFLLKVTGAFSSTVGAKVILINGAMAKNVYWKIDGAVALGVNTEFAGTMVVAAGAIALRTGVVLAGRGLTMAGAVSTASSTTTMFADGTLPVTWLSFTGKPLGESVLLEWVTANELNNGFFTILKSRDGRNFEPLTTIAAHGEQKDSRYHYSFSDKLPYKDGYYNISQTDHDGKKSTYKTIRVKVNVNESFKGTLYVQQSYIYLKASGAAPASGIMRLYTLDGRLVSTQLINLTKDVSTFKINRSLQKGVYVVQVESLGVQLYNKKVAVF